MHKAIRIFAFTSALLTSLNLAHAQTVTLTFDEQKLEECKNEIDRVDRLKCWDTLLGTPINVIAGRRQEPSSKTPPAQQVQYGPIETVARQIENLRTPGQKGWMFRYSAGSSIQLKNQTELLAALDPRQQNSSSLSSETLANTNEVQQSKLNVLANSGALNSVFGRGGVNIYLTLPETPPADAPAGYEPAILMLSCEADITTVSFIPGRDVKTRRLDVRVQAGNGAERKNVWQSLESGRVVITPRGIGSIDFIGQWINSPRLQFTLYDQAKERVYLFNSEGLDKLVTPLRRACHW